MEERERSQKEEKLTKAGKKISLAVEELNTYRLELHVEARPERLGKTVTFTFSTFSIF